MKMLTPLHPPAASLASTKQQRSRPVADGAIQREEHSVADRGRPLSGDFPAELGYSEQRWPHSYASPQKIQAKLEIGEPGDHFEQEADAVADRVIQESGAPVSTAGPLVAQPRVQRKCSACDHEEGLQRKPIQRKAKRGGGLQASPALSQQLQQHQGGGMGLPPSLSQEMGRSIGADFGNVRIHADATAASLSRGINARAFTHGQDIYFNQGEYNPSSTAGKHLLAHELTHVVQQAGKIQKADPPLKPGEMTRKQFEETMRDTYGVPTVRNGTLADQRAELGLTGKPDVLLPDWASWDPGPVATVYQDIVDSFAAFNTTFSGFPRVQSITFFNAYYERVPDPVPAPAVPPKETYYVRDGVGAQFGTYDLTVFKTTTTARKGLPIGKSVPDGKYDEHVGIALIYGGDPNAAPIRYPTVRQTAMRLILHELGHGLGVAAAMSNYDGHKGAAPDPAMILEYMQAVGWARYDELYDIGVPDVATAIAAKTTPDAKHRITEATWNDPKWQEQPVSDYMVSGGPGEDFAEAVMTYIHNEALLKARSPHRHAFIVARKAKWQPQLAKTGPPAAAVTPAPAPTPTVKPSLGPSILPLRSPMFGPSPDPLLMKAPLLGPDPSRIDWLPIRNEFVSRGATFDPGMQAASVTAWTYSYNFYNGVLRMGPDASTAWSNRTVPRLIGAGLTRDYPSMGEASDRGSGTSAIIFPVSDILKFLMGPK